jgi:uncharacterized membrane protein
MMSYILWETLMKNYDYKRKNLVHISFEIGILLKGVHAVLEIVGGTLLIFVSPDMLNQLTELLTKQELFEDPNDLAAKYLLEMSSSFSISTQRFVVFYLVSHGIIKLILVLLLWRKKLWAYPLTIVSLILFIAYQGYRYTSTQSIALILLTAFDLVMIWLTYLEYKRIKSHFKRAD